MPGDQGRQWSAARRWLPVFGGDVAVKVAFSGQPGDRTATRLSADASDCQNLASLVSAALSSCGSERAAMQVRAVALNRSWRNLMARALARLIVVFVRCEMHGAQARTAVINPFFWVSDHLGWQPYGYPVSGARPPRRYLTHEPESRGSHCQLDGERICPWSGQIAGAGDGNRTRTVSLGVRRIQARHTC